MAVFPTGTSGVRIQIFPDRVASLLASNTGPVSRANKRAAEAIVKKAIPLIGTKYSTYGRFRRGRETNHKQLAKSGKAEPTAGAAWRASFISDHALVHHVGNKPITAKTGKFLVFQAREGGQVWTRSVKGFKGNPYLTDAARKLGVKVSKTAGLRSNSVMLGRLGKPVFRKFL